MPWEKNSGFAASSSTIKVRLNRQSIIYKFFYQLLTPTYVIVPVFLVAPIESLYERKGMQSSCWFRPRSLQSSQPNTNIMWATAPVSSDYAKCWSTDCATCIIASVILSEQKWPISRLLTCVNFTPSIRVYTLSVIVGFSFSSQCLPQKHIGDVIRLRDPHMPFTSTPLLTDHRVLNVFYCHLIYIRIDYLSYWSHCIHSRSLLGLIALGHRQNIYTNANRPRANRNEYR